jgi:hypothetical protein
MEVDYAFGSSCSVNHRGWCPSLAREHLHTDGTTDQIDSECRGRYRPGCVAAEYFWASDFHFALSDWSRLITTLFWTVADLEAKPLHDFYFTTS